METIDKNDIQGILVRGYNGLDAACFLLLKIKSPVAAKCWIAGNIELFTPGHIKPDQVAANIAFTLDGLRTLGLDEKSIGSFSYEFQDGMDSTHKQRLLGDYGNSDPVNWKWGAKGNTPVHILLMLYARNNETLDKHYKDLKNKCDEEGFEEVLKLETKEITARKEHFGFHDGIAQPTIKDLGRAQDHPENIVAAGEFILGYKNEYGQYTDSPSVASDSDKEDHLPVAKGDPQAKDLGRNGTFLVIRQLEQDVQQFWDYMEEKTKQSDGTCNPDEMIKLASKVVGRWPGGAPLALSPEKDDIRYQTGNDFNYIPGDKEGMKCPFGAHVRRTNPRDSINRGDSTSTEVSNKHRILRRGRSYGSAVAESMRPEDILKRKDRSGDRGLYFICLNADLGRQFEFIQNFWINNPKFDGLYDERDPLTGNHSNPQEDRRTGTFGIPCEKIRERFTDLPEFVTVKGGSYFFLPGIKALRYLSSLKNQQA